MAIQSPDRQVVNRSAARLRVAEAQKTSKLVFHRYGSQYFLAQIWTAGNDRGQELPESGREREVAMDYPAQNVVVVAALR